MQLHALVMNPRIMRKSIERPFFYFISLLTFQAFLLGTWGCDDKSSDSEGFVFTFKDVPQIIIDNYKITELAEMVNPRQISYKKGNLIIGDSKADTMIFIYNANSMELIGNKGINGFGPMEFPDIWNFDRGTKDSSFWAYSLEGKSFNEFQLFDQLPFPINQVRQSETFFLAMGMAWTKDETLMTVLASGPDKFVEFSPEGNVVQKFGLWKNTIPGDFNDFTLADIHQGQIKGVPSRDKFIKASIFRDRIEILDRKTGKITIADGPLNKIPVFDLVGENPVVSSQSSLAFTSFDVSDNLIAALLSGEKLEFVDQSRNGEDTIILFEISGKPMCILKSPIPIFDLTLDEEGKRIFGISEGEISKLVELQIPNEVFEILLKAD